MKWIWSALALLLGRGRRSAADAPATVERQRLIAPQPPSRRGENVVLLLLVLATLCAIGFIAVYALDRLPAQTQLLGIAIGLAFAFVAAAAGVASRTLVPVEEISEPYPEPEHETEQEELVQLVEESGERLTRRGLVKAAAAGTGLALGAALVTPAASLGPVIHPASLRKSRWRRGVRLVDSKGRPLRVDDIDPKSFYTAFPEGMTHDEMWSPLVVVRVEAEKIDLPAGRDPALWAPDGVVAYSKICTHAACAIALYRTPTMEETSARPGLVCPCHYSTFDPARGGEVLFGPAGRPLPQLPLLVDDRGELRAGGNFSGPIGPSWWGVRWGNPDEGHAPRYGERQ